MDIASLSIDVLMREHLGQRIRRQRSLHVDNHRDVFGANQPKWLWRTDNRKAATSPQTAAAVGTNDAPACRAGGCNADPSGVGGGPLDRVSHRRPPVPRI